MSRISANCQGAHPQHCRPSLQPAHANAAFAVAAGPLACPACSTRSLCVDLQGSKVQYSALRLQVSNGLRATNSDDKGSAVITPHGQDAPCLRTANLYSSCIPELRARRLTRLPIPWKPFCQCRQTSCCACSKRCFKCFTASPPPAGLCQSPAAALPTPVAPGRGGMRSTWQPRRLQDSNTRIRSATSAACSTTPAHNAWHHRRAHARVRAYTAEWVPC